MKGLKEKREARELSLRQVGKALGVHLQTIFNYEKGTRFPNAEMLKKLAAFFNCTIDELM